MPYNNLRFESLVDEMTYYKQLTQITAECIINNSETIKEQAEKVLYCGTQFTVSTEEDLEKITSANFCRLRLCPMCQRRKSLKTYADISKLVEALPNRTWVHMVLTVQNVTSGQLQSTISHLFKSSTKLLRKNAAMKHAFNGALRCCEVTYNATNGTYHPHLHLLLTGDKSLNHNSKKRISKRQLADYWKDAAELDYTPQVHLDYTVDSGVVAEIAKYCVKPLQLDLSPALRAVVLTDLYVALYGRRLIQTYGEIRKTLADLKINLEESPENGTLTNSTEQMFVYDFDSSQYVNYNRFYNLRNDK